MRTSIQTLGSYSPALNSIHEFVWGYKYNESKNEIQVPYAITLLHVRKYNLAIIVPYNWKSYIQWNPDQ